MTAVRHFSFGEEGCVLAPYFVRFGLESISFIMLCLHSYRVKDERKSMRRSEVANLRIYNSCYTEHSDIYGQRLEENNTI